MLKTKISKMFLLSILIVIILGARFNFVHAVDSSDDSQSSNTSRSSSNSSSRVK